MYLVPFGKGAQKQRGRKKKTDNTGFSGLLQQFSFA
jgi:hypothetical protein